MPLFNYRPRFNRHRESGQTFMMVILLISMLLLAMLGFAIDYTQIWAQRQMVQGAADSACQAAAADLFLDIQANGTAPTGASSFNWIGATGTGGAAITCSDYPNSPPCKYAAMNGYSGSEVAMTFPTSVTNSTSITGYGLTTPAYVKVTITHSVQMSFSKLISSASTKSIAASATCGMSPVKVAIPLVILHPTLAGSFSISGGGSGSTPAITIVGGPARSIQVNSLATCTAQGSSCPANIPSSTKSLIDLSGASTSGGSIGVSGSQPNPDGSSTTIPISFGSGGSWISPAGGYTDPFALVSAPSKPAAAPATTSLTYNGIPNPASLSTYCPGINGCTRYQPGYYPCLGGGGSAYSIKATANGQVSLFDPGLYYLDCDFQISSNGVARMSLVNTTTGTYANWEGAMFYFSAATAGLSISPNAATPCTTIASTAAGTSPNNCVVPYPVTGVVLSDGTKTGTLNCAAGSLPSQIASTTTLTESVLLAPCSGTYGDPSNVTSGGKNRGFLFFHDRSTVGTASFSGGGSLSFAGIMYFHQNTSYGSSVSLGGTPASSSYAVGNIISDQISTNGNANIKMILSSAASYQILRPQLLK